MSGLRATAARRFAAALWRRLRAPSITWRLSLLFAAGATAVLLGVGIVLHRAVDKHFLMQDAHDLHGKLDLIRHHLQQAETPERWTHVPTVIRDALFGHHDMAVDIRDAHGNVIVEQHGSVLANTPLSAGQPVGHGDALLHNLISGERTFRVLNTTVDAAEPGVSPVSVRLAIDITHHIEFMAMFRQVLAGSIALAGLVSLGLGWFAARRGLQPLQRMAAHARTISASRLRDRLPDDDVPPELSELLNAFNAMLARLEDSFRRLSDFSSDIAHELRTPVSNLMTHTQVALSRARSDEEYREVLHSNLEEFDRLGRMIADMLFLAKADNGLIIPQRIRIDLAAEIDGLIEFYDALAADRNVTITRLGEGSVDGDPGMLQRAISNLLSNALRHTAAGEAITVRIAAIETPESREAPVTTAVDHGDNAPGAELPPAGAATCKVVRVRVDNPGPSISPEHLPRLFDRFYRADPSRHKTTEGAGLGLAITKSIVEAHGGMIVVRSAENHTTFEILLPAAA